VPGALRHLAGTSRPRAATAGGPLQDRGCANTVRIVAATIGWALRHQPQRIAYEVHHPNAIDRIRFTTVVPFLFEGLEGLRQVEA
jgi:hypothetical protein